MDGIKAKVLDKVKAFQKDAQIWIDNDKSPVSKLLTKASQQTKLQPLHIALGVAGVLLLLILFSDLFCDFASLLVGAVYPVYRSLEAIDQKNAQEQRRWLVYWIIASVFLVTDFFYSFVSGVIPVYAQFKLFFLVWCVYPMTPSGPEVLYDKILSHVRARSGASSAPAPVAAAKESLNKLVADANEVKAAASTAASDFAAAAGGASQ
eukprot:m.18014 g.18014  ORF g.18014 m.18014 type:complete len:207 (+) comp7271_c0_seq1:25-645(+)